MGQSWFLGKVPVVSSLSIGSELCCSSLLCPSSTSRRLCVPVKWCGGWDSNPRRPSPQGPKPKAGSRREPTAHLTWLWYPRVCLWCSGRDFPQSKPLLNPRSTAQETSCFSAACPAELDWPPRLGVKAAMLNRATPPERANRLSLDPKGFCFTVGSETLPGVL